MPVPQMTTAASGSSVPARKRAKQIVGDGEGACPPLSGGQKALHDDLLIGRLIAVR